MAVNSGDAVTFFFFAFQARILFCFLQVFLFVWGFFPGILTDLKNVLQPD